VVKCGGMWYDYNTEVVNDMFMGEFEHNIDTKGRVIVPAKLREDLGENFIITRGLDHCLFVYPLDEWHLLESKLKKLPLTRKDARAFTRFFFSGATECQFDKQGRVNIPQPLRMYASLTKECTIIGVSNRIEVWAKEVWEGYFTESEQSFADIAENLLDFDI